MNSKDRDMITRLYDIIDSVPKPHMDGANTASIVGAFAYANDMREFLPALKRVLLDMCMSDTVSKNAEARDAWVIGEDYENPSDRMSKVEQWLGDRRSESWAFPRPQIAAEKGGD